MKSTTLGSCCDIVSGATPKTSEDKYWSGTIAWATPSDLSGLEGPYLDVTARTISEEGLNSCSAVLLPVGAVLLSTRAPIGHLAINTRPMATNQGFKSLIPDQKDLLPLYLYQWLRARKHYLQSMGNGATFKELSKAAVARIPIVLPSLDEQAHIASQMLRVQDLIAWRSKSRRLSATLKQVLFREYFGNIVTNSKGWQSLELNDWIDPSAPITYGILKPGPDLATGVPYVRVTDIAEGRVDPTGFRRTSIEIDRQYRRSRLSAGDLVVSIRGHVGRVGKVPKELEGANITQDSARLRVQPEARAYVAAAFESGPMRSWLARHTKGAAVKGINLGDLRHAPLPRPPSDTLAAFTQEIDRLESLEELGADQLAVLNELDRSMRASIIVGRSPA